MRPNPSNPPKILLVDDIPKNIQVLARVLKNEGYRISYARSGTQALKLVKEMLFDLILLDVVMPEMDGYTVCTIIKNQKELDELPVIFLTQKDDHESILKGFEVGAVDYIKKPFHASEVLARVKTHIHLRRSQKELKQEMNLRLKIQEELIHARKMEALSILAGGIAHDYNNILQAIYGNLFVLKQQLQPSGDAGKILADMETATQNAIDLTRIFLNLSSASTPVKESVPLTPYLTSTLKTIAEMLSLTPVYDIAPDLWTILLDRKQFFHVFYHLLKNAKEANDKALPITIEARNRPFLINREGKPHTPPSPGDQVRIRIKDQGRGIHSDFLPKIFDPYVSSKPQGSQKGMGLGLTLVRSFIRKHDGDIHITSDAGMGTEVVITLPALQNSKG